MKIYKKRFHYRHRSISCLWLKYCCLAFLSFIFILNSSQGQTTLYSQTFEDPNTDPNWTGFVDGASWPSQGGNYWIFATSTTTAYNTYLTFTQNDIYCSEAPLDGNYSPYVAGYRKMSGVWYCDFLSNKYTSRSVYSPAISALGYSSLTLDFDYRMNGPSPYATLQVQYSTDGTNFTTFGTYSGASSKTSVTGLSVPVSNTAIWIGFLFYCDGWGSGSGPTATFDNVVLKGTLTGCGAPVLTPTANGLYNSDMPAVCSGSSFTLNAGASGGVNCSDYFEYAWLNNTTGLFWNGSFSSGSAVYNSSYNNITAPGIASATTYTPYVQCHATPSCASTGSSITVNVTTAPTIVTQPANSTICNTATSTTFDVVSSGGSDTYAWYVNKNDGNGFVLITGAMSNPSYSNYNTSSLTVNTTGGYGNGYGFRCDVTGCSNITTSNSATLSLVSLPGDPSNAKANGVSTSVNVCSGNTITLTATKGTNGDDLIWYSGASSCTQTTYVGLGSPTISPSSTLYYNAYTANACGLSTGCSSVQVIVDPGPAAPTSVTGSDWCTSSTGSLTANGVPSGCTAYFYSGDCNENLIGTALSTGSSATLSGITVNQPYQYACGIYYWAKTVDATGCASACTKTATAIFVYGPPSIYQNPGTQTVGIRWGSGNYGGAAIFPVGAQGDVGGGYKWYYNGTNNSTSGGVLITTASCGLAGTTCAGYTTSCLSIIGTAVAAGTYYFYCTVTGATCTSSATMANAVALRVVSGPRIFYSYYNSYLPLSAFPWCNKLCWSSVAFNNATNTYNDWPNLSTDIVYLGYGANQAQYQVNGNISVGTVYNGGSVWVNSGCTMTIYGTYNNYNITYVRGGGAITMAANQTPAAVYNEGSALSYTIVGLDAGTGTFTIGANAFFNVIATSYSVNIGLATSSLWGMVLVGQSATKLGSFSNAGTLNIIPAYTGYHDFQAFYGTLTNTGTINNYGGYQPNGYAGLVYAYTGAASSNSGTLNNIGYTWIKTGCTFNNNGIYKNEGWIWLDGTFNNNNGANHYENGETELTAANAKFRNFSGGYVDISHNNEGYGILGNNVNGSTTTIQNDYGGTIDNRSIFFGIVNRFSTSVVTNSGTINNYGVLINNGTFSNTGTVGNKALFNQYNTSGSISGSNYFQYNVYANLFYSYFASVGAQTTSNYEWPPASSTSWPYYVKISNSSGVTLNGDKSIGKSSVTNGYTDALILNSGALKLNKHTLTIDDYSFMAINRDGATNVGYLESEDENSILQWNVQDRASSYTFPFGRYSGSLRYIPFIFNITSSGGSSSSFIAACTYHTGSNNLPLPTAVDNILHNSISDDAYMVDRWWLISAEAYPANSPTATVRFTYESTSPTEYDSPNTITESDLQAQHWNVVSEAWDAPVGTQASHYVEATGLTNFSPWTLVGKTSLLPVNLVSFNAECNNAKVNINWSTASETNSDYFNVERSKNNIEWEPVSKISAAGNSNTLLYYSTQDKDPYDGLSYYRLKQVDFDGQYEIFDPVATECTDANNNSIEIVNTEFNETLDQVTITYYVPSDCKVEIYLINDMGQMISSISNMSSMGLNMATISLRNTLAIGLYMVSVQGDNDVYTQKIYIH